VRLPEEVVRMRVLMNGEKAGKMEFGEVKACGKVLISSWVRSQEHSSCFSYQVLWHGVFRGILITSMYYVKAVKNVKVSQAA
jgi:hypothetical protein